MDIWKVLELEPCKDKEKITKAYREKLLVTNPEDSPEEFKKLRAAYEEACDWADTREKPEEEECTPLGQWMNRVKNTYMSIQKRGDEEAWKKLLSEDICIGLDTKPEARDRLLKFLMDYFRLPQNIWRLLDETFDLKSQKEELIETFPEDFISYILREMEESCLLPLEYFQGDEYADYDKFISLLYESTSKIDTRELDSAKELIDEMKELNIYHPYLTINEIRIALIEEAFETARKKEEELYMIYPEDSQVILYMGETSLYLKKYEEAIEYYDRHLEKEPKSFLARYGKSDCLRKQKKYKEAKDLIIDLLNDYPYNNALQHEFQQLNEEMIEDYRLREDGETDDTEVKLELGWSYIQNSKIEEGIALLAEIHPQNQVQEFSYINLSGRLYLEHEDFEKAMECFKTWETKIRELPEEVPEELQKDKNRLQRPVYFQAATLDKMGQREEALRKVDESLEIKKDVEAMNLKAYLLYENGAYEETIEVCNELQKIEENRIGVYAYRGKALYELGYYQAAFEDFNQWLNLYAYNLDPYIYKMRIFIYYEQYEQAKEIADYLINEKVESDRLNDCIAQIKENAGETAQKSEAYEMYKQIITNYQAGNSDVTDIYRIYYYMAVADEHDRPVDYILSEIDKGLSYKKDYIPLLDYKAYILNKNNKSDHAIAVYKEILSYHPGHTRANTRIGDILYDRKDYKEALEYYLNQRRIQESQGVLVDIGCTYIELGKLDEAKEVCQEALRMDPEESCLYHNLGIISVYQKRFDEAIAYYEAALEHYKKEKRVSANTHEQLAACYARRGEFDKARKEYETVREETGDPYYYVEISDLYKFMGQYQQAEQTLETYADSIENDTQRMLYEQKKAALMVLSGDYQNAYKYMKKCKLRSSVMEEALIDYYIIKRNFKKAQKLCQKRIVNNPESISAYCFVSLRGLWMGNIVYARQLAQKGLELQIEKKKSLDDHILGYCRAAVFQAVLGRYEDAFFCIKKAQECTLCAKCRYAVCKDVEIIAAQIYDIMGDRRRAMDILYRCASYCKDDTELYLMIERLRR